MRILLASAGLVATAPAAAQTPPPLSAPSTINASASAYAIEDDEDYVQPTIIADRDHLHFEARFNYEDRDTGSAWVGYNGRRPTKQNSTSSAEFSSGFPPSAWS